jgi:putative hydrolase of the HAD superfamily
LHESGIKKYFTHVFISEEMGVQKPDRAIFDIARKQADIDIGSCIMIGDNFVNDIEGALKADWKAVYYTPRKKRIKLDNLYQIKSLLELKELL